MKKLRIAFSLFLWILSSCALPISNTPPLSDFVLVTANPSALPSPTPFQPNGAVLLPTEALTLIPSFTPEPPTNTPPPTLAFTATLAE